MKKITTSSFEIASEQYYNNLPNILSFEYRFIWSEFAFRYVLTLK